MTADAPINAQHEKAPATETHESSSRQLYRWRGFANRYALVGVFAAIVVLFSILKSDTYPTVDTWQAIASTQAVIAVLALSAMLPLIVGQFDVSIGFQL